MANILVSEFFVFATVQVGQVTMFLKTSNKTDVIICSAIFLSLYEWTFKDQSPKNGISHTFQAPGNILLQKVQSQHD